MKRAAVGFRGLRIEAVTVLAFGALLTSPALPQAASPPKADAPSAASVPVELFHEPRVKHIDTNGYPLGEIEQFGEGWVNLGFMVDPKGKPYEITVLASTGDKTFEQDAVRRLGRATFEPGTVNGKPTESATKFKVIYRLTGQGPAGARTSFVRNYRKLLDAIGKGDRPAADAAMGELKITNLYEDAFYGLGRYRYALKWGTKSEQLAGLTRAVAFENTALYLPKNDFQAALVTCFALEVQTQRYGEALDTWHTLERMHLDGERKAQIIPIVEKLNALQTDDRAYAMSGVMSDDSWSLVLFKHHFRVDVSEGHVSVITLYCSKRYVAFAFDPKLQYDVEPGFGSCWMEMQGDPGTKFTVSQF